MTTRERILAAATELIAERGFARVTTRAVAERAGVNVALPNYYFGSKETLLADAATDLVLRELGRPALAPRTPGDVAAHVRMLGHIDPDSPGSRALAELTAEAARNNRVRAATADMLRRFRAPAQESLGGDRAAAGLAILYTADRKSVV